MPRVTRSSSPSVYECTVGNCRAKIRSVLEANFHPLLGVLVCRKCYHTYGDGDFAKLTDGVDENGDDNFCRWCVDGGDLYGCSNERALNDDRCHFCFCKDCIVINLPDQPLPGGDGQWLCYACKPEKLKKLREQAKKAMKDLVERSNLRDHSSSRASQPVKNNNKNKNNDKSISESRGSDKIENKSHVSNEKPTDKSNGDVNIGWIPRSSDKGVDKRAQKTSEKEDAKTNEKIVEKHNEKGIEKSIDKSSEKSIDKTQENFNEKSIERSIKSVTISDNVDDKTNKFCEKSNEKTSDESINKATERTNERQAERANEKPSDTPPVLPPKEFIRAKDLKSLNQINPELKKRKLSDAFQPKLAQQIFSPMKAKPMTTSTPIKPQPITKTDLISRLEGYKNVTRLCVEEVEMKMKKLIEMFESIERNQDPKLHKQIGESIESFTVPFKEFQDMVGQLKLLNSSPILFN